MYFDAKKDKWMETHIEYLDNTKKQCTKHSIKEINSIKNRRNLLIAKNESYNKENILVSKELTNNFVSSLLKDFKKFPSIIKIKKSKFKKWDFISIQYMESMYSGGGSSCDNIDAIVYNKKKNNWFYLKLPFSCTFEILKVVDNNLFFKHCELSDNYSPSEYKAFMFGHCSGYKEKNLIYLTLNI